MRVHEIFTVGALALLAGEKLLVNALPAFDYTWSNIRTERFYGSIDECDPDKEDCFWPELFGPAVDSNEHDVPAVRVPKAVHPHDTYAIPAATATTISDIIVTSTPCTQDQNLQSMTTPAPDLKLQRRDNLAEDIPSTAKTAETTLAPNVPTAYPCDTGACDEGFKQIIWAGMCMCFWNPSGWKTTK